MIPRRISSVGSFSLAAAALLLLAQPGWAQHAGFHAGFRAGFQGGFRGGVAYPNAYARTLTHAGVSYANTLYNRGFNRGWYAPAYRGNFPYYSYWRAGYPRYSSWWGGYPYAYGLSSGVDLGSAYTAYPAYNPFAITYPIYTTNEVVATPAATTTMPPEGDTLRLQVLVPPSAEVWINGAKMNQRGAQREFVSPPLTPGSHYAYSVRARWDENGQVIDQTREVKFAPGQSISLNFNTPQ
jgi:uncharacterized protein (TIGR03000 family)